MTVDIAPPSSSVSGRGHKRPAARGRLAPRGSGRLGVGLFLSPAVLLVAVLLLLPFLVTLYQSFTAYDGLSAPRFTGLDNYTELVTDPSFLRSLLNTFMWTVGTLVLPVALGLLIAVLTNSTGWAMWLRYAFVLPYAISGTATAVVWGFILRSDGALNQALAFVGLDAWQGQWLLSWPTNTIVMILASTWQMIGVAIILFLVGLQTIPPETVEAGTLDGASGFRLFRHIVLPQLRPVTVVVVGISIANSLKVFDLIWLLTGGGPGGASETLAVTMYRQTFVLSRYGYGSAIAVVLAVIVIACSWVYIRRQMPRQS